MDFLCLLPRPIGGWDPERIEGKRPSVVCETISVLSIHRNDETNKTTDYKSFLVSETGTHPSFSFPYFSFPFRSVSSVPHSPYKRRVGLITYPLSWSRVSLDWCRTEKMWCVSDVTFCSLRGKPKETIVKSSLIIKLLGCHNDDMIIFPFLTVRSV